MITVRDPFSNQVSFRRQRQNLDVDELRASRAGGHEATDVARPKADTMPTVRDSDHITACSECCFALLRR